MKKIALVFALLFTCGIAIGQWGFHPTQDAISIPFNIDDDESVIMVIKYIGSEVSGTVDINAGNLELHHGDLASEAADTNVTTVFDALNASCGVTAGIDLAADAACDTWGEVVDGINSTTNWRAVLIDQHRSGTIIAAGADVVDPADGQAKVYGGLAVLQDCSDVGWINHALLPWDALGLHNSIEPWIDNDGDLIQNPLQGWQCMALGGEYLYGDGDADGGAFRFYTLEYDTSSDRTEEHFFSLDLGADDTIGYVPATPLFPVWGIPHQKMTVQLYTSGTMDATNYMRMSAFCVKAPRGLP